MLVLAVPLHVGLTLLQRSVGLEPASVFDSSVFDLGSTDTGGQLLVVYGALFAQSLLLAVAGLVVAKVVVADICARPITVGQALGALRRLPAVFVAWLVTKLAIVVGGCFFVGFVPVIVWTLALSPVIAVEGLGPFGGLQRSIALTSRRWFACLGVVLLTALVSTVIGLALSALPLLVGLVTPLESSAWILAAVADLLSTVIVVPIVAATAALAYFDLRVRTEGLDLQLELDRG
jgi:hypothetical protein